MKTGPRVFLALALCMAPAFGLAACGGGGGDDNGPSAPPGVKTLYTNGADWNDYVINNGTKFFSADDTACTGGETGGYDACLHGGEMRVVEVTDKTSCTGLTATDALGAFDWTCIVDAGTVKMVSAGFADGKNLSDLLDFTTPGWKDNSVTVLDGGVEYFTTVSAVWWTNPVVVDNDGGYLNTAGAIYVVTEDALAEGYIINASSVGLVGKPGVIINGPAAGTYSYVVSADGTAGARDFLWLEGALDATGDTRGVSLNSVRFSMLRNVTAENALSGTDPGGVYLTSSMNNILTAVTASNNYSGVWLSSSNNNTLTGVKASGNDHTGVFLSSSSDNTLTGVTALNNSFYGVYLHVSSDNNTLSGVTASNNNSGVWLSSSNSNTFTGVKAANNVRNGVVLISSNNNTLTEVTASNNSPDYVEYGVWLSFSNDNMLAWVTASNNNHTGVYISSSNRNALAGVTAANNGRYGVRLVDAQLNTLTGITASNNGYHGITVTGSSGSTQKNTLSGVTASNNGMDGVYLDNSSQTTLSGVAAANNGRNGVHLTSSSYNDFTGLLKVGGNEAEDCAVAAGIYPGLVDVTCTASGTYNSGGTDGFGPGDYSDAILYNGITHTSSFVGKVVKDDIVNRSDGASAVAYPANPDAFDWTDFQNAFRGWGLDGAFGQPDSRGRFSDKCSVPVFSDQASCTGYGYTWNGSGRIWDWSLAAGDTGDKGGPAVLGELGLPTGNDTFSHVWAGKPIATFLRNAVEVMDDSIGNDDTLCESGETCLYTPNIGSYQGHGSLTSAGPFTDGDPVTGITGVTLLKYARNGYN